MILDFHVRPPYASFLALDVCQRWQTYAPSGHPGLLETDRQPVPSAEQASLDMFLTEMDAAGISRCVVAGRKSHGHGCVDNDDIARLVQAHPKRFVPFAGIDPLAPDAVSEVERLLGDRAFRGICVDPGLCASPMYADDPRMQGVFAACAAHSGIAILTSGPHSGPDLSYADPNAVARLARSFPHMPIVVAHAGWPFVDMAVAVCQIAKNVYLAPDCYFAIRDMPMANQYLAAGNSFLKYRMLFSSSYPVRGLEQSVNAWKNSGLRSDVLERVLYKNAQEVLGAESWGV